MIAFGICGSFCNHKEVLNQLKALVGSGEQVLPIFSEKVQSTSTRFGKAVDFIANVELICGRDGIKNIVDAEKVITGADIDCMVIAPCTGNTLARLALGITDGAVTMAAKAHLRNQKPLLVAFASNDALSGSLKNIATLLEKKNIYFVPMKQDDPEKKPTSLVCDWSLLPKAIEGAKAGKQLRPLIVV